MKSQSASFFLNDEKLYDVIVVHENLLFCLLINSSLENTWGEASDLPSDLSN